MFHSLDVGLLPRWDLALIAVVTIAWFFALGASFGSFLNVLVYRLPRGRTLVRKPSSCPSCDTPILPRDNVPVFGWLWLRGRCRACGWAIPVRYPLIEAAIGLQFSVLMLWEVASGGWNIPVRSPDPSAGFLWAVWPTISPDLLMLLAYHLIWLYTCTAIVLMATDGHSPPAGFVIGAWLILWLAPVALPQLAPLLGPFDRWSTFPASIRWQALGQGLLGGVVGGCIGFLLSLASRHSPGDAAERTAVCVILCLTGTTLGWQAVLSTALLASLLWMLRSVVNRVQRDTSPAALAVESLVAAHLQIFGWRWLSGSIDWPGHRATGMVLVLAPLIVLGIALAFPRPAPTAVVTTT